MKKSFLLALLVVVVTALVFFAAGCKDEGDKPGVDQPGSGAKGSEPKVPAKEPVEEKIEISSDDLGDSYVVVMDMRSGKGPWMRIENRVDGDDRMSSLLYQQDGGGWKLVSKRIANGDDGWILDPNTKTAIETSLAGKMLGEFISPEMRVNFNFSDLTDKFGKDYVKEVAKEKIADIEATKHEIKSPAGVRFLVWVDGKGRMLKRETHGRTGDLIDSSKIVKLRPMEFSDDEFKPPKDYKAKGLNIPGFDPSTIKKTPGVEE